MDQSKCIICVLLDKQREEYDKEFAQLQLLDAEFIFESSADAALDLIGKHNPHIVIIGMDIGDVEGIEFIAMLMSRYQSFSRPVVMLPDKADGLPVVAHTKDPSTGRSAVESVEFDYIAKLITQPPLGLGVVAPEPEKSGKSKSLTLAIVGVLVVVVAILCFVFLMNGKDSKVTDKDAGVVDGSNQLDSIAKSENNVMVMPLSFKHGKGVPTVTDSKKLDAILDILKKKPGSSIEVTGHTSILGNPEMNFEVGMVRAKMVVDILVKKGISRYRFTLKSVGETEPIASNSTEEGQAKNRRVTIQLVP